MSQKAAAAANSAGGALMGSSEAGSSGAGGAELTSRERFVRACRGGMIDRPPAWLMRQAGRVLPEYRALKERYSFLDLVRTPELATEVTLQPVRRFGFDAAILFSDILVIPEALGQAYHFREGGGVTMESEVRTAADVAGLEASGVRERLGYVDKALRMLRPALGEKTALIGFAGSPWTLANFMLEGGSVKEYARAKALFYSDRVLFDRLFEKLTEAVTEYLRMQIEAGVDAVQIFDSLGGELEADIFEAASGEWMRRIIGGLGGQVPVIVFSKGTNGNWEALGKLGAQVIGVDWTVCLKDARGWLPEAVGLQGNLDPAVLTTTPANVETEVSRILRGMRGRNRYIFNLGHGVPPAAGLENIEQLMTTVRAAAGDWRSV